MAGTGLDARPARARAGRTVRDAAGREIAVPERVERVFAAGPPASIFLYTLAPARLLGWNRRLGEGERAFIVAPYRDLPVLGRLTGRGNTASVEAVLRAGPDVILDYGSTGPTYVSLAERVQGQTGVPYLLLDGAFVNSPASYRLLGDTLGVPERAGRLAAYAADTLALARSTAERHHARPPRVYYGRGPDGLETGLGGSINVELLTLVGAENVAATRKGGLTRVSMEQILDWDPEVVLTLDERFHHLARTAPLWRSVRAVRDGRVYLAPRLPFGWFDRPPSVNRLIGVHWLRAVLGGSDPRPELHGAAREFYRLFYHLDLDDRALARVLGPEPAG